MRSRGHSPNARAERPNGQRWQPWQVVVVAGVVPIVATAVIASLVTRHSSEGILTAAHHGSAAVRWTVIVSACAVAAGAVLFRPVARIFGIARDAE